MYKINSPVYIISGASVVGQEEVNGPLGARFDYYDKKDDTFGYDTWEKAESEMQRLALGLSLSKTGLTENDLNVILAGDLVNQCISSNYGLLDYDVPYLGLYGACSTCAEGLLTASLILNGSEANGLKRCAAVASSHNATAERQFRSPLEYGGQRSPTAQWTVTGAGSFILSTDINDLYFDAPAFAPTITSVLPGRSIDAGINDITNMGGAMAPAAADTLLRFFNSSGNSPSQYDGIFTGDLGYEGSLILRDIMRASSCNIEGIHYDCGLLIYDRKRQDKHAGGSGCGCSAVVLSSLILERIRTGIYKKVLFVGTGALMNPMSLQQGMSIPGIAHLVEICAEKR